MPYCTPDDVAALMTEVFTETSHPDQEEAEAMCDQVSAELDGVAQAAGYATPVTTVDGLALLKRYATFGVAPQVWYARYATQDEPARVAYWRTAYADFVARLRRGEQQLPGETETSGPGSGFSAGTRRVDGYTSAMGGYSRG